MEAMVYASFAASRRRTARRLLWFGFAILAAGLFIGGSDMRTLVLSYGALITGTILSWTGVALLDRWVMPPRAEDALGAALEGMHGGWKRYHWSLPGASHVLQAPWGLVIIDAFNFDGTVQVRGKRWRDARPLWRRLLSIGRRPVRDPRRHLQLEERLLRDALAAEAPDLGQTMPLEIVQVLTNPRASVDAEEPSTPILMGADLRRWLQRVPRHKALPPAEQRRLREALDALAAKHMGVADGAKRDEPDSATEPEGEGAESA
jgi:hypothetical protein